MGGLWQRLMQRKLAQWMTVYVAACFALIQVLDVVAQRFGLPGLVENLIILAMAIGFFIALALAWYHGERGAQSVGGTELLIIALLLAIGGGVLWVYARTPAKVPAIATARSPDGVKRNSGNVSIAIPDSAAGATASGLRISVSAQTIPEKSVAVLPFTNESGNKDEQYFSDGLSDDLITALSQFAGLKVISRNSAFQFRNSNDSSSKIGKLLGVAHLLEGSVQRAGGEVRITAALVNAADGSILWSQRDDKPYKDLFALQDAITHSVAAALQAKLLTAPGAVVQSDRPPSGNLAAYAAYQHGITYQALGNETGERKAIDAFNEAIRLDPKYAAAYAQLARTWNALAIQFLTDSAKIAQARAAARKASAASLKLDWDSSLAHQVHAVLLQTMDFDWAGAEAETRRALQLSPNDPQARFTLAAILSVLGQNRRAVELARQALASDPRDAIWYSSLGTFLSALGELDEARQAINTAIALQPGAVNYQEQVAVIEILRGDAQAALAATQAEPPGPWHDVAMALALQLGPDRAVAGAALAKLVKQYANAAPYQIAEVYGLRKDPDAMFKWLDNAWTHRDSGIASLLRDPPILRYRDDPRFAAFAKKVGLPATTDAVAMK